MQLNLLTSFKNKRLDKSELKVWERHQLLPLSPDHADDDPDAGVDDTSTTHVQPRKLVSFSSLVIYLSDNDADAGTDGIMMLKRMILTMQAVL